MRLLVVSQYFWPESFIINDLVRTLAAQGHELLVFTGKPNYPDGDIFDGYSEDGVVREQFDGRVPLVRAPLRARRKGMMNLARNYISFVVSGCRYLPGLARDYKPDAIIVFAPSPITAAIPAVIARWRAKAHLALWVQDLWPESLSATGHVTNSLALKAVGLLVRGIYACCDTILVQSRAFVDPVARLAASDKIIYYPNSVLDTPSATEEHSLPHSLLDELANHFCVVFAGNIGSAQAVETLVDCAERLSDVPELRIVLIGSGSKLDWVNAECKRRRLTNLVLPGRFPMAVMPTIFAKSQALLVTLRKDPIFSYTVPSKVQAYMAAGRPIIASLDGEGARLIEDAGAGLCGPAEDVLMLEKRLRELHAMSERDREEMGKAGRRYFLEHFEMGKLARRLTAILASRMNGQSA